MFMFRYALFTVSIFIGFGLVMTEQSEKYSCLPEPHYGSLTRKGVCATITRLDGVRVGYTRTINLSKGRRHRMITKSLKPLAFLVPEFFSAHECDEIIQLAKTRGLQESKTISNENAPKKLDPKLRDFLKTRLRRIGKRFRNHFNGVKELQSFIHQACALQAYSYDCKIIFDQFDSNADGVLSEDELISGPEERLEEFVDILENLKEEPRYRARYSYQTWLSFNVSRKPVLKALRERLVRVTKLPKWVIGSSEDLQVVRYSVSGHYHGHYDSTEDEFGKHRPCCQGYDMTNCHLCRFMTILFFLNDVTRGGETAFLVPNTSTNLSLYCNNSTLLVKPKKGTALIWYNHFLDPNTGLLGNLDRHSLHGGCDVIEGAKWIANSWINIPKQNLTNT